MLLEGESGPYNSFWEARFSRKGQYSAIFLICEREETVGKLSKLKSYGSLFNADIKHSFLYTIE